jgi:hypothetical protein
LLRRSVKFGDSLTRNFLLVGRCDVGDGSQNHCNHF